MCSTAETQSTGPTPTSVLDKLETKNIITEDGNNWVKCALDPFHDFNLNLSGLPDATTGSSVVRFFKKKVTLVRPTGLAAADKWDCHIFTLPLFDAATLASRNVSVWNGIEYAGEGDLTAAFGTVNVVSGPSDGEWFSPTLGFKGAAEIKHVVPTLSSGRRSLARVIGCAFEVHNDTPTLYKGGSVTAYDCPQGGYDIGVFNSPLDWNTSVGTGTALSSSGPWMCLRRPPDNVSEAMQMPNSVTWEAAEGCYVVNKIDLSRTNYQQPNSLPLVFFGQGGNVTQVTGQSKELVTTWQNAGAIPGGSVRYRGTSPLEADTCYRLTAMHTSGAYFNGLPPETILTLEVHIIVESLPVNDESELALASPAAEYDPMALQLYERSIRFLKSGVPVHMNAKGDWWKMVGRTLLNVAPQVANMIVPGSGTLVNGLIGAGKAAKSAYDSKKNKQQSVGPSTARLIPPEKKTNLLAFQEASPKQSKKKKKSKPTKFGSLD